MARFEVFPGDRPEAVPALLPVMPMSPMSTIWGANGLEAHPGNQAIPSPRPGALPPVSANPLTQPSMVAPDVIFPTYSLVHDNPGLRGPVARVSQHTLPVPAVSMYKVAAQQPKIAYRARRFGGTGQVAQPGVATVWPDINSGWKNRSQ
jgi:hypothetical protein